jgi:hypothetical protein
MYRHIRMNCKIANSDEGMEKLMDHTLQKQLSAQNTKIDVQSAKIDELTTLVKQMALAGVPSTTTLMPQVPALVMNKITTTMTNQINHQTINIIAPPGLRSFDSEDRLVIPAALVKAAFTENPRLAAYCKLSDEEKTDAEAAAPYVLEALMELVKRAHKDPLSRNVYLNPKRADQALVFVDSDDVKTWEVRPLLEAIRRIFDTIAGGIHRVIVTDAERSQLPFDVQSSASWIPNLYDDEPDKYVKEAKQPMAAHLTNTRPTLQGTQQLLI